MKTFKRSGPNIQGSGFHSECGHSFYRDGRVWNLMFQGAVLKTTATKGSQSGPRYVDEEFNPMAQFLGCTVRLLASNSKYVFYP